MAVAYSAWALCCAATLQEKSSPPRSKYKVESVDLVLPLSRHRVRSDCYGEIRFFRCIGVKCSSNVWTTEWQSTESRSTRNAVFVAQALSPTVQLGISGLLGKFWNSKFNVPIKVGYPTQLTSPDFTGCFHQPGYHSSPASVSYVKRRSSSNPGRGLSPPRVQRSTNWATRWYQDWKYSQK